jgi:hypothetical protein
MGSRRVEEVRSLYDDSQRNDTIIASLIIMHVRKVSFLFAANSNTKSVSPGAISVFPAQFDGRPASRLTFYFVISHRDDNGRKKSCRRHCCEQEAKKRPHSSIIFINHTMPSNKLAKLRVTLALLDNNQDGELFTDNGINNDINSTISSNSTAAMLDAKLIQRYESLRHEYISKTIEKAVLEEVVTFDGTTFDRNNKNDDDDNTEHQQQLLEQRHEQVLADVIQAARQVHAQAVHVQTERAVLQQRKAEILRMVEELEGANGNRKNVNDDDNGDVHMDGIDVSEQDFAAEEACLADLQEQKVLLQAKLRLLQQETHEMEQDTKNMLESEQLQKVLADKMLSQNDDDHDNDMIAVYNQARARLQAENDELRQKVKENKEMISYFDGIRLVMQELGGIRLLSVEQPKTTTTTTTGTQSDDTDNDNSSDVLVLTVQFLKRHDVEIHLQARENETKRNADTMRVTHARIITPTVLQGPAAAPATNKVVKLDIPPLDDLVQVAKSMPDAKGLHFLVAAILDRLETIQLRVEELSILQNSALAVLTHVGPTYTTSTTATNVIGKNVSTTSLLIAGGQHVHQHQEIACRLVAYPLVAILRLSPDCPRRAGSVVLDQVVVVQDGNTETPTAVFAQGKEQLLDDILKNLQERQGEFTSPVQVIQAIVERVDIALKKIEW